MRILLIYPPITLHKQDVSIPSKSSLIGLGYLAAVLRKAEYDVKVLDCLISSHDHHSIDSGFIRYGMTDSEIYDVIRSFQPDVVGISSMFTSYFRDAHNVAKITKQHRPDTLVIFGGSHTTTFPERVLEDPNVDLAVIGEGELTLLDVFERYKAKRSYHGIRGTVYRNNGKITREQPRAPIADLDQLPFPAWDLLEKDLDIIKREHQDNRFIMRKPVGHLLTSRGCPNNCYFCSVKLAWGKKWRARSPQNVVDEIEYLMNRYGFKEFHFVDDNSSVSKKRMHDICDEILTRKINVKIATPTGIAISTLEYDLLKKMKKAGFYRLCFGIESGDPVMQKKIKKNLDLKKAHRIIQQANSLGFWTAGTFIIGHPNETMKEIRASLQFAKASGLDFALFYLLSPQPKTEVYRIMKDQGIIDLDDYIHPDSKEWYKLSITYCNGVSSNKYSNEELHNILSSIYKQFIIHKLFSIRTYLNIVKKLRSVEDIKYLLRLTHYPLKMIQNMFFQRKLSNISLYTRGRELEPVDL